MFYLVSAVLIVFSSAHPFNSTVTSAFTTFMQRYGKSYDTVEEYSNRLSIFADSMERVAAMNALHNGGDEVFGVTKFSDLSPQEFKQQYLSGFNPSNLSEHNLKNRLVAPKFEGPLADSVDWRNKGAVTDVRQQGSCGSCWAFSATNAIESFAFLAGQGLQVLSAQQITSCDHFDIGCRGGDTPTAYGYVELAGGLETERAYPYRSGHTGSTGSCQFDRSRIAVSIRGYVKVGQGESNLRNALNQGPVSVCLNADTWQYYRGGLLQSCGTRSNHCVQATGYGPGYWNLRNSWGHNWGEQGYIRLATGRNMCGVANEVTYPVIKGGGSPTPYTPHTPPPTPHNPQGKKYECKECEQIVYKHTPVWVCPSCIQEM